MWATRRCVGTGGGSRLLACNGRTRFRLRVAKFSGFNATRVAPTMLRTRPVHSPLGQESLLNRIRQQSRVRPHRGTHDQGHLDLGLTPIDEQFDSSNKAAVIRGEEHDRFGDVVRIAQPPQRDGDGGQE